MVVRNDDRAGICFERNLEDDPNVDNCTCDAAFGYLVVTEDLVLSVQHQHVHKFDVVVSRPKFS